MSDKERLSATVDAHNLAAAQRAFREGRAPSVSAWVNDALALYAAHEARMRALDEFIKGYERKHGAISDDEIEAAYRAVRARAVVVRGKGAPARSKRRVAGRA